LQRFAEMLTGGTDAAREAIPRQRAEQAGETLRKLGY
jgi:hypothetical protein